MKSVLISIKPKWCELIANGEKTVEIRKTKPKLETPFKCYIYCPLPNSKHRFVSEHMAFSDDELFRLPDGTIKHGDSDELMAYNFTENSFLSGRVIGEFVCDKVTEFLPLFASRNGQDSLIFSIMSVFACLEPHELEVYLNGSTGYGWHISDLVIYDEPKELEDFCKPCTDPYQYCQECKQGFIKYPADVETYEDLAGCCFDTICINKVTEPPKGWRYVEED